MSGSDSKPVTPTGTRRIFPLSRRMIAAVALIGAIVAILASLPFLISSERIRASILAEAMAITGRKISFRDAPRITISPFLGIEISNVIFEDPYAASGAAPLLQMERLKGRLEVLPALVGRISISRYQFVRPRFHLRDHGDGRVSWAFPQGQMWNVLEQAQARRLAAPTGTRPDLSDLAPVRLGIFEIVDGTIEYENRVSGRRDVVTNLNGTLDWQDTRSAAQITAQGIWRGEAFRVGARVSEALLLLSGSASASELDIASSAISLSFRGEANMLSDLQLRGTARIETPSLRRFMELAGNPLPAGSTLAGFSASGKLEATQKSLNFTETDLTLDGNRARGSLQIVLSGRDRPKVSATLAFSSLDTTPYLAALRQDAEMGRDSLERFDLSDRFELDLRLSAARARIGVFDLTDLAAAFSVQPQEILIDVGNAQLFGGTAIGTLRIGRSPQILSAEAKAIFHGISAATLTSALSATSPIKLGGNGDVEVNLRSEGSTLAELAERLQGEARLAFANGTVGGVDLAQMRSLTLKGDLAADISLSGETAFRKFEGQLDIIRRLVLVRNLRLQSSRIDAVLNGKLALGSNGVAMRLTIAEAGPGPASGTTPPARPGREAVLFIGGSLTAPLVTRSYGTTDQRPLQE